MRYARDRGSPVPQVHDVAGSDLSLERVDGRVIIDDLVRRPEAMGPHCCISTSTRRT